MDHYEMVEKLRQKANVTYEEAKAALEASDWDILDALVLLESEGKVKDAQSAPEFTTQEKREYTWETKKGAQMKVEVHEGAFKLWDWIKTMFRKGNANQFVITRKGEEMIAMPITVLVLLLLCFWPFSLIVLFVGLFLGARYSFRGPDIGSKVNDVIGKVQENVGVQYSVQGPDSGKGSDGNGNA